MNNQTFLYKLGGYYLIPHELLHVLAYRLIGKRCHYQWGDWQVKSLQPKNRRENLFVLLFPFITCIGVGGGLVSLSFAVLILTNTLPLRQYTVGGLLLPLTIHIVGFLIMFYGHVAGSDLIKAYWWLFHDETKHDSPNPDNQTVKRENDRRNP